MGLPILDDIYIDNGGGEIAQINHLVDLGNQVVAVKLVN